MISSIFTILFMFLPFKKETNGLQRNYVFEKIYNYISESINKVSVESLLMIICVIENILSEC